MGILNKGAKDAMKEGLALLPDGEYDAIFEASKFAEMSNGDMVKFSISAMVAGGAHDGHKFTVDYILVSKGKINNVSVRQLKKELLILGFPAEPWFAEERLEEALTNISPALAGMNVKVKKRTSGNYANADVISRTHTDGKPTEFTDEIMQQMATQDIPF